MYHFNKSTLNNFYSVAQQLNGKYLLHSSMYSKRFSSQLTSLKCSENNVIFSHHQFPYKDLWWVPAIRHSYDVETSSFDVSNVTTDRPQPTSNSQPAPHLFNHNVTHDGRWNIHLKSLLQLFLKRQAPAPFNYMKVMQTSPWAVSS